MKKGFILGNPRSGTSLLRLMLNAHPDIVSPPESGFLHWWWKKYKEWNIEKTMSEAALFEYVVDLLSSKKIETWHLSRAELINFIKEKQPDNYGELAATVYEFYSVKECCSPSVILDKNNYYINHLEELDQIWPNSYYIYLIRDGRDVACSYVNLQKVHSSSPYKPVLPVGIEEIAKEWNDNNLAIQRFLAEQESSRWVRIRYEDLVQKPVQTLRHITDFLGIDFSYRMINYVEYNDEPEMTIDWKKKTLSNLDLSNIGKYKYQLSKHDIQRFNEIAEKSLKFGEYQ